MWSFFWSPPLILPVITISESTLGHPQDRADVSVNYSDTVVVIFSDKTELNSDYGTFVQRNLETLTKTKNQILFEKPGRGNTA